MTTAAERNSDRAKQLVQIFTSGDCEAIMSRRAQAASADPGMESMMQMLRGNGIDIDARFEQARADCRHRVMSGRLAVADGDTQKTIDDCSAEAQQIIYTRAINEMNTGRQTAYEREMARFNAEVAAIERRNRELERRRAEEQAAYEREMAEWRRAVRLCDQGQREYCQPE